MVKSRSSTSRSLRQRRASDVEQAPLPAERRIISILAVDVVESTRHIAFCDPEDAQALFDRCFDHVRGAIERSGGTLVSYEGDGGIATFGWPGALEHHADHACEAACEILEASLGEGPDGRPIRFRIGVHAGLVAVRQLRGSGKSRLDTVGVAVHLAAKLQKAARPGGALISEDAVRMCRRLPKLGPRTAVQALDEAQMVVWPLEGIGEPLSQAGFTARYRSPMVGRQAELALLAPLSPRSGGGSVALVGEPGIGKSRFAAELVGSVDASGARILIAFGDLQKRTTAFAVVRSLFAAVVPSDGVGPREQRILAESGLGANDLGLIAALLAGVDRWPRAKTAPMTDIQLARLFTRAFMLLIGVEPTMILVEDLHLIDPESQLFLRLLRGARHLHPLLVLITARPESHDAALELCDLVVKLEPLPRSAMRALAELLWPRGWLPSAPVVERFLNRADGVPLVLEELVRAPPGNHEDTPALPPTFGSLIHARLSHLSPDARRLAQALSLLGESTELDLAGRVLDIGYRELLDQLDELDRFSLVHPIANGATQIRHQIIADACAETIPREQRRELHRLAYGALSAPQPERDRQDERLAFHAEGAGELPRALDHLWSAALAARRSSATASLSLIFDRAVELSERIGASVEERYVDLVLLAFAAMIQRGEFEKMNRHLPRVIECARMTGRPERISSALSQLGMICWFEGRFAEGLRATEEGLAIARTLNSPALFYANMIMQTNLRHCLGQVTQAIAEQRELCTFLSGDLESARLGAAGIPSATALSFMSWFLLEIGDYAGGLDYVERGLAIAVREKDLYAEVLARNGMGRNLIALDRNQDAVECLMIAREIAAYNGFDAIRTELDGRTAIALSRCGRAAEALAIVEATMAAGLHLRTGQLELYCLLAGKAEALLGLGQFERGLDTLADALALARRIQNPCLIVDTLGLRARAFTERRLDDAQVVADLAEQSAICRKFGLVAWPNIAEAAPLTLPSVRGSAQSQ